MKTIKTFLIGALVALVCSSAGAKTDYSKATINLLEGENQTVDTDDLHPKSGSFSWQITQQGNDSIATCAGFKSSGTSHQVLTFTGVAKGTTVWEFFGDEDYWTYTINVEAKPTPPVKEVFYEGQRITFANGAYTNWVGSELVVTFKADDTMKLPVDLIADILVIGGGGAGVSGSTSSGGWGGSTKKYGSSGNGGKGSESENLPMPAGTYTIKIGAGGTSSGSAGNPSSIEGAADFTTITGAGADRQTDTTTHSSGHVAGTNGFTQNGGFSDITGENLQYGVGGAKATDSAYGKPGDANTGNGGVGGYGSGSSGGAGGSGVVIVRFTDVAKVRTPIAVPTAAENLVYGWTNQVGVAEGEGYVLTGVSVTNAVGAFTAYATPDDDHCWMDKSRDTKEITWSIAYRAATVTVIDTNKVTGAAEPIYRTRNENFIAEDQTELVWTAWRTNTSEEVGTYDVVVLGETHQGGYEITYVGGTLEITPEPPPTFDITIAKGEGIDDVQTNGVSVVGTLELPAGTTQVELELEASGLTVPVFKVVTNDVEGVAVTSVTTKVATYAIKDGDTLEFFAEEAEEDDKTVTPEQRKQAIIDAIDDENKEVVAPKIEAVVDTAEPPTEGKVAAKEMAKWITDNTISSSDMADSDYLVASVKFDTKYPITDENTEVEFTEVEAATSDDFVFTFDLKIDDVSQDLTLVKEYVASCIQTTGDLGTGFETTVDASRVMVDSKTGKVTITPDPTKTAEFFKIIIPQDPGAK